MADTLSSLCNGLIKLSAHGFLLMDHDCAAEIGKVASEVDWSLELEG